jgi:hypothetical protein
VKNGFVSVERAAAEYAVVIDAESQEIDHEATRTVRAAKPWDGPPRVGDPAEPTTVM